jgi:hypothetical protein
MCISGAEPKATITSESVSTFGYDRYDQSAAEGLWQGRLRRPASSCEAQDLAEAQERRRLYPSLYDERDNPLPKKPSAARRTEGKRAVVRAS